MAGKKWRENVFTLDCVGSAVYVGTIAGTIYASCVISTGIYLACVLTYFYATAVIVVMSSCLSLLWYSERCWSHGHCRYDCYDC